MRHRLLIVLTAISFAFLLGLLSAKPALAEMLVLSPTADASVNQDKPLTRAGHARTLVLSYDKADGKQSIAFLRFDVSQIPHGSTISEATVKVFLTELTGQKTVSVGVFRATSGWTDSAINWQNKPTGPGPVSNNSISNEKGYKSFDATSLVDGWVAGSFPNQGLFLADQKNRGFVGTFHSQDDLSNQPQLLVYFTPPQPGTDKISGMPMASGRAPQITKVETTEIKDDEATITWSTDGMTNSKVRYGLSAAYSQTAASNEEAMEHKLRISDLKSGRTYHYRVYGRNKAGLESMSADFTFKAAPAKPSATRDKDSGWGWLKLVGMGLGILALIVLTVIGTFELKRWRRGEPRVRG